MSLAEYKGPANSPEIFRHLVGSKITAAFQVADSTSTSTYLVDENGDAFVFNSKHCAYWREPKAQVDQIIARRRREIENKLAELRDLPGVEGL